LEFHNQALDYLDMGAHNQNGLAEKAIQTIANWS